MQYFKHVAVSNATIDSIDFSVYADCISVPKTLSQTITLKADSIRSAVAQNYVDELTGLVSDSNNFISVSKESLSYSDARTFESVNFGYRVKLYKNRPLVFMFTAKGLPFIGGLDNKLNGLAYYDGLISLELIHDMLTKDGFGISLQDLKDNSNITSIDICRNMVLETDLSNDNKFSSSVHESIKINGSQAQKDAITKSRNNSKTVSNGTLYFNDRRYKKTLNPKDGYSSVSKPFAIIYDKEYSTLCKIDTYSKQLDSCASNKLNDIEYRLLVEKSIFDATDMYKDRLICQADYTRNDVFKYSMQRYETNYNVKTICSSKSPFKELINQSNNNLSLGALFDCHNLIDKLNYACNNSAHLLGINEYLALNQIIKFKDIMSSSLENQDLSTLLVDASSKGYRSLSSIVGSKDIRTMDRILTTKFLFGYSRNEIILDFHIALNDSIDFSAVSVRTKQRAKIDAQANINWYVNNRFNDMMSQVSLMHSNGYTSKEILEYFKV